MAAGAEEQLVERLKRRDETAFNEFVRLYEARVYRLVFRMLHDQAEAEDVAQEVFLTVFKSIDSFRGESKLGTWLYRVASNHAKNRIKYLSRRAQGKKKVFDEIVHREAVESATMSTSSQIPRPDQVAEGIEIQSIVRTALSRLPEDQRELVVLRDIENLTYDEIQEVTQLAAGTVKSRLHRARLALQKLVIQLQSGESPPSSPSTEQK